MNININIMLLAIAVLALAAAIMFHAQTNRYQITAVAGLSGVYRADTRTGDLSICSPIYQQGCITIEQAHQIIEQQKENVRATAGHAQDKINEFTRDRAEGLRNLMRRFDRTEAEIEADPVQR